MITATIAPVPAGQANRLETTGIFDYDKQDENYNLDTESLQDDWDYFCALQEGLNAKDPDAAREILDIEVQSTVDENDSNA